MLLPSQKPAKAFFLVFAFKMYLRHQSVMPFLSGVPPPKKNPGSAPASVAFLLIHDFEHFSEQSGSQKRIMIQKN